jgi:hypothetical protein
MERPFHHLGAEEVRYVPSTTHVPQVRARFWGANLGRRGPWAAERWPLMFPGITNHPS